MHDQPVDKNSKAISVGDTVLTKSKGKEREGKVQDIAFTDPEAQRAGAKNPPKVILKESDGHEMQRDPAKLEVNNEDKEYKSSEDVGA